ncbi:hypothetical protein ACFL6C_06755 [Myxococcota bacterium]
MPNRFLMDGFFAALGQDELLLYLLLVLAGDRQGLSFYHYDRLCSLLGLSVERYLRARNSLIQKDLIAFDGTSFQVLELPMEPPPGPKLLSTSEELEDDDAATVHVVIRKSLRDRHAERGSDLEFGDPHDEP